MGLLEGRLEGILEEFNSQNVANTLLGVCDNGEKAEGAGDGARGGAGSGDGGIRGLQLEESCKHSVGVCDYGDDGASGNNGAGSRGSGWVSTRRMLQTQIGKILATIFVLNNAYKRTKNKVKPENTQSKVPISPIKVKHL
jgi:hypothetical protein